MNLYYLAAGAVFLAVFIMLPPRVKVLLSFFAMVNCFDLFPSITAGREVWDIGAVLLMVTAGHLLLIKRDGPSIRTPIKSLLIAFWWWLAVCFVYSIVVYNYPMIDTIKSARQMLIGYFSFFVFLRLFEVDKGAFEWMMKWLYVVTFLMIAVAVVQIALQQPLLSGLQREYHGQLRYIPTFLPVVMFFLWSILSRFLSGGYVRSHEVIFLLLAVIVVAATYTRGLYLEALCLFILVGVFAVMKGMARMTSIMTLLGALALGLVVVTASGVADNVVYRIANAIHILNNSDSGSATAKDVADRNTFIGRLLMFEERFSLAEKHNPAFGYGFLHEDNVPKELRRSLTYGSIMRTPEMQKKYEHGYPWVLYLFSPDGAWGNLVIKTGFVGVFLFVFWLTSFFFSFLYVRGSPNENYFYCQAFYLQLIYAFVAMLESYEFTHHVEIPALFVAGYVYSFHRLRQDARLDGTQAIGRNYREIQNNDHHAVL